MLHSCLFPYYCPANSSVMKSCEGGFMPVNTSGLRASKNSCCSVCEGGTYRPYLSPITQCLPCPAGYFCPPGTPAKNTTHNISRSLFDSTVFIIPLPNSKWEYILFQQVLTIIRVTLALLDMFVRWDPLNTFPAPLVLLVTSVLLREWPTATRVQLAPLTTCTLRRLAFLVAAPPLQQLVSPHQLITDNSDLIKCFHPTNKQALIINESRILNI